MAAVLIRKYSRGRNTPRIYYTLLVHFIEAYSRYLLTYELCTSYYG